MKYLLILSLLLVGCDGVLVRKPPPKVDVPVPSDLISECPPINELEDKSFGALLRHDTELQIQYTECRQKVKRLKEALDKK
jgi:hypothetical protein